MAFAPAMWATRRTLVVGCTVVASAVAVPVGMAEAMTTTCSKVLGQASVAGPTPIVACRAGIEDRTAVFYRLPGRSSRPSRWLARTDTRWVLVVAGARAAHGRCWLRIRLPWRPNVAAGWVNVNNVVLQKTPWRIVVSRAGRTLTLFRAGAPVRTMRVVVGKPSTPTPTGLFGIVWGGTVASGRFPRQLGPRVDRSQRRAAPVRRWRRNGWDPWTRRREPPGSAGIRAQPRMHSPGEQLDRLARAHDRHWLDRGNAGPDQLTRGAVHLLFRHL